MSKIDEIEQRAKAATEGPWQCSEDTAYELQCQRCGETVCEDCLDQVNVQSQDEYNVLHVQLYGMHSLIKPNAEFIAHARTDVPWLVSMLREAMFIIGAAAATDEQLDHIETTIEDRGEIGALPDRPSAEECRAWLAKLGAE